ncbi:unnamed protein product [Dibothriocephalus latus]|uniref:Amine oxidase domain-containing protein n=1 Tax=Dibothriocephalus latus TaxID=60516 RepID=A0A3P6QBW3_DIBLA|nr:unnamed protein product [Dibothriocephalus latus]
MDPESELPNHLKDIELETNGNLPNDRSSEPVNSVDVLIIGAGVAGLAAAQRLKELHINDFHILEGRHRIGGRIATTTFQDVEVCEGPVYIHGHANNIVAKLAKQLGIAVHPPNPSDTWSRPFTARTSSSGENIADQVTGSIEKHRAAMQKLVETPIPPTDASAATVMAACGWDPISPVDCVYDFVVNDMYNGLPPQEASTYADKKVMDTYELYGTLDRLPVWEIRPLNSVCPR